MSIAKVTYPVLNDAGLLTAPVRASLSLTIYPARTAPICGSINNFCSTKSFIKYSVVNGSMQKAPKKKTIPVSTRLEQLDYRRLLAILKRDSKYLNQGVFMRDAIKEKITIEEAQ